MRSYTNSHSPRPVLIALSLLFAMLFGMEGSGMTFGKIGIGSMMYRKLDKIIEAVEYMDGLDHSGDVESELAASIKQLVRRKDRRAVSPVQPRIPVISGFETGSAFAIMVTSDMIIEDMEGRGGFTFGFYGITLKTGHSSYSVNWGDGTTDSGLTVSVGRGQNSTTCLGHTNSTASQIGTNGTKTDGTAECCHTYTSPGMYIIQISDDIDWFRIGETYSRDPFNALVNNGYVVLATRYRSSALSVVHALRWGSLITYTVRSYSECVNLLTVSPWTNAITDASYTYTNCTGLISKVPEWGTSISIATDCFSYCYGLTGSVPDWPDSFTSAQGVYGSCFGLTGRIPEWGKNITNASYTFQECGGMTGEIPVWGPKVSNTLATFNGCRGLVGTIPEWGSSVTQAMRTFGNCSGLHGLIPDWTSTIVSAAETYRGCEGLIGTVPQWGDSIETCNTCYYQCYGISGKIPEWGPSITNVGNVYGQCTGLDGVWDDEATDAELMPSRITSYANAVNSCLPSIRNKFLTTWGGTRES